MPTPNYSLPTPPDSTYVADAAKIIRESNTTIDGVMQGHETRVVNAEQKAIDAANLVNAPADTVIATAINGPGTQTQTALSAAIMKQQVELDVRSFGNFAEASDWTVNRDAMQAANDYAATLPAGAVVKLPAGKFKVKGVYQDSHVTFRGHGTTLEHPDGLAGHMIIARTFATTGSIVAGSFDLTVASATNIEVGTVVAITGARGLSDRQNTLLASSIDATQTAGITLADPYGFPVSGHMTIGSEVIKYTGISDDVLTGVTRGMYGTTAAAHGTVGPVDAIGVSAHHIAQVVAVSGTTITLDRPAPVAMTGAPVNFSIVDPGIYDIRIEGNRDTTAQVHYPVYWATVGNGHGDNFYAHHAQTTIFLGLGATGNKFGTVTADSCLLRDGIGASFWMFQSCRNNRLDDLRIIGAMFIGVYIDDRTTAASPFDGPGEDNHVGRIDIDIPVTVPMHQLTENTIGLLISGGLRNSVGEINASGVRTGAAIEHGGQWQNWNDTPPTCEGNVVGVFRGKDIYQPWYIDAPGNAVLDAAYTSYLALGVTTGNPHIGHAIGPNGEQAARYHDGTKDTPAIAFRAEQGTGFYRPAPGMMQASVLGEAIVRIRASGLLLESGKHILFAADNTADVGGLGGSRPRDVRAARFVAIGTTTTAGRLAPGVAGAGAMIFDTTLGKPIWSTGAQWVDAAGTVVT